MEKLTQQEEDVMRRIWSLGRCAVKDIVEQLPDPRPPYTTVASVVQKLKCKGYVRQESVGKTYFYTPLMDERDYKHTFLHRFVHDYFGDSVKDMLSFFAREEKLSGDDIRAIVNEIEKGTPS